MATAVVSTNLLSEAGTNVYDLVKSNSNVADPVTSSSEFRKWVYRRMPDVKDTDFSGFPFIVVHPATFEHDGSQTGNGQVRGTDFAIEVEIVTSDRGYNNMNDKGLTHLDSISDAIVTLFNSNTTRNTLRGNNLRMSTPQPAETGTLIIADKLCFTRSMVITFKGKKLVF